MNINLNIERLVLDGVLVEPHQQAELKMAVESELGRLLSSNGVDLGVQSSNSAREVSGGVISIGNTYQPASFGKKISNAIYKGIKK